MRTFDTREAADEAVEAATDPVMVCGTFTKKMEPRYFLMPAEAEDDAIADAAFQIREGRLPSEYERTLLELAKATAAMKAERVAS